MFSLCFGTYSLQNNVFKLSETKHCTVEQIPVRTVERRDVQFGPSADWTKSKQEAGDPADTASV